MSPTVIAFMQNVTTEKYKNYEKLSCECCKAVAVQKLLVISKLLH